MEEIVSYRYVAFIYVLKWLINDLNEANGNKAKAEVKPQEAKARTNKAEVKMHQQKVKADHWLF